MERKKEVLRMGSAVIALALVLRCITLVGALPLENEQLLAALIYLQTGRVVRYWDTPTQPTATAPRPESPKPQPAKGLQFAAEDARQLEFYDFTGSSVDIPALLQSPLDWQLTGDKPTVLILHTHATESYTRQPGEIYEESSGWHTLNASYNMLSLGEELTRVLTAGGISVLHDRTFHDYPSYTGSYDHARKTIKAYLEAFPTIEMVIDLHRDALDPGQEQLTTSATVGNQKSAQLLLIAGSDRNASHPRWQENLALNVKLTALLERMYPGITRPLQLRQQRYNLDMTTGSILVEVGGNGDSHPSAIVAVRALGAGIIALAHGANL